VRERKGEEKDVIAHMCMSQIKEQHSKGGHWKDMTAMVGWKVPSFRVHGVEDHGPTSDDLTSRYGLLCVPRGR